MLLSNVASPATSSRGLVQQTKQVPHSKGSGGLVRRPLQPVKGWVSGRTCCWAVTCAAFCASRRAYKRFRHSTLHSGLSVVCRQAGLNNIRKDINFGEDPNKDIETIEAVLEEGTFDAVLELIEYFDQTLQKRWIHPIDYGQERMERCLWFMARGQQVGAAVELVELILYKTPTEKLTEEDVRRLYHAILQGIDEIPMHEESQEKVLGGFAEAVAQSMLTSVVAAERATSESKLAVAPNEDSVAYLMRVHMHETTSPVNLLRRIRQWCTGVITWNARTMETFSSALLRAGQVEMAYVYFLASRLEENGRPALGEKATQFTRRLVSQLARALALTGQVLQLKRLLERVADAGGTLLRAPGTAEDTCAAMLAGRSVGRTLATAWLEPSKGFLRRREVWSSESALEVNVAEQFQWDADDLTRNVAREWGPYLPPDTKVERAWLSPLCSDFSSGMLGLLGSFCTETLPAEAKRQQGSVGQEEQFDEAGNSVWLESDNLQVTMGGWGVKERSWRCFHRCMVLSGGDMRQKPSTEPLAREKMSLKLREKLAEQLDQDFEADVEVDGSSKDELRLALDISALIRRLGGTLSEADLQAMCQLAYSVNDPSLSTEVMKEHSSILLQDEAKPANSKKKTEAEKEFEKRFRQGGWEKESVSDFMEGKRPFPTRNKQTLLGSLSTNKIDPLHQIPADKKDAALEKLLETTSPTETFTWDRKGRIPVVFQTSDLVAAVKKALVARKEDESLDIFTVFLEQLRNEDGETIGVKGVTDREKKKLLKQATDALAAGSWKAGKVAP